MALGPESALRPATGPDGSSEPDGAAMLSRILNRGDNAPLEQPRGKEDGGDALRRFFSQQGSGDNAANDDEDEQVESTNEVDDEAEHDEDPDSDIPDDEEEVDNDDDLDEEDPDLDEEDDDDPGDPDADYLYYDEERGQKVFLAAVDEETGEESVYLTRDDAAKGLAHQLNIIGRLKNEVTSVREETDTAVGALEKELAFYRSTIQGDNLRAALILQRMPEDLRRVDPKTLEGDDYKAYQRAAIKAELQLDNDVEKQEAQQKDFRKKLVEAKKAAKDTVNGLLGDKDFVAIPTAEGRIALRDALKQQVTGLDAEYTVREMVEEVAKEFGPDYGKMFLRGIIAEHRGGDTAAAPTAQGQKTSKAAKDKATVKKTVKRVASSTKTDRRKSKAGRKAAPETKTPRETLKAALEHSQRSGNTRRRR